VESAGPLDLQPSAALSITGAAEIHIVRSGSLALFAHHVAGGTRGARRYVAALGPGDPLFGVPPVGGAGCTLVAVANERLVLERYDAVVHASTPELAERLPDLVKRWRDRLVPFVGEQAIAANGLPPADILVAVQRSIVERLVALDREDEARGAEQLSARRRAASDAAAHVLREMTSTLRGTRVAPPIAGDSPLLAVTRLVAAAQGLSVSPSRDEAGRGLSDELSGICRASRLRWRRVLLAGRWWNEDQGPLVAFTLDDNRPVALLPADPTHIDLVDPAAGVRVRVDGAVAATVAPTAVLLYRRLPDTVSALDLIRFAVRGRGRDLAVALCCALAATGLHMLWPVATSLVVDAAIPDANRALLLQVGMGLLAAVAGRTLFDLVQAVSFTRVQTTASTRAQPALWDRVLNLRVDTLRRYAVGDLQARIGAISLMTETFSGVTLRTILAGCVSLLNIALMVVYSPALTLVAIAIAVVVVAVTVSSGASTVRISRRVQEAEARTYGLTVQLINAVAKLQVAGAESRAFAQWGYRYTEQQRLAIDAQRVQDRMTVFNHALPTLALATLFATAGAMLARAGQPLSAGAFVAFSGLFGTFIGAIAALSNTVIEVADAVSLWRRVAPLLDAPPEVNPAKTHPGRLQGRIELERVRFRYRADGPLTLTDVSIRVRPGEFVALVGPSGSGKSTLFRLILGFDMPASGSITLDGQDLSGLDLHAVRRQFGVVLQGSRLVSGSIFENIAAGGTITLGEAWEALRRAGLEEDVQSWPMGIHTYVSEGGGNLSGGQRQRLLIARALVHSPAVLLFDEATSALDNQTQAVVSRSVEALGVTRIIIAHRLSTIRGADRIYVLDGGCVVQEGTFDELVQAPGLFATLMARQRA
jgi:NHLM bacteriocin system ABC transporter ATP-binding protein